MIHDDNYVTKVATRMSTRMMVLLEVCTERPHVMIYSTRLSLPLPDIYCPSVTSAVRENRAHIVLLLKYLFFSKYAVAMSKQC